MFPGFPRPIGDRLLRYYAFRTVVSFQLWSAFWVLWLAMNLRTADGQATDWFLATWVDVAFWVVSFLMAIPAGLLSDRYGRKPALLVGASLWSLGVILFGLSSTFPGFVLANSVWAIGAAFMWGIDSAYLYDTLAEAGLQEHYPRIASQVTLLGFVIQAVAATLGGYVALVLFPGHLDFLLLTTALTGPTLVVIILGFKEPRVDRRVQPLFFHQLRDGLRTVKRDVSLQYLIAFQVILGYVTYLMAFFRQDFLGNLVARNYLWIGVSYAGYYLIAATAGLATFRILRAFGEFGSLLLSFLLVFPSVAVVYFVSSGLFPAPLGLGLGLATQGVFFIIWGFEGPLMSSLMNRRIESRERALILGISGLLGTLILAILEPLAGYLVLHLGYLGLFLLDVGAAAPTLYVLMGFRGTFQPGPLPQPLPAAGLVGPGAK